MPLQHISPLSPSAERERKQREDVQRRSIKELALKELIRGRLTTSGKATKGDILVIVKMYKEAGHDYVTKGVLDYMIMKQKESNNYSGIIPVVVANNTNTCSNDHNNVSPISDDVEPNNHNKGGRPKGDKKTEAKRVSDALKQALTRAATLCAAEKDRAESNNTTVTPGKFKEIIELVENESQLVTGSINIKTIRNRILRKNLSGFQPQSQSPLHEIEPIIVQYCLKLARIKQPLTRDTVIRLAQSLIENTVYSERLRIFNEKNHSNTEDIIGL